MFFIQKRDLHNLDTVIPNSFFELVLPMLAPKEHALAVYMLGYYESVSIKEMGDRISSNQELAEVLGISVDDVYEAWEYCESLGLIKKFVLDEEVAGSYQIEFRDLRTVLGKPKGKATSTDELIAVYKNEEYKKNVRSHRANDQVSADECGYPKNPQDDCGVQYFQRLGD